MSTASEALPENSTCNKHYKLDFNNICQNHQLIFFLSEEGSKGSINKVFPIY